MDPDSAGKKRAHHKNRRRTFHRIYPQAIKLGSQIICHSPVTWAASGRSSAQPLFERLPSLCISEFRERDHSTAAVEAVRKGIPVPEWTVQRGRLSGAGRHAQAVSFFHNGQVLPVRTRLATGKASIQIPAWHTICLSILPMRPILPGHRCLLFWQQAHCRSAYGSEVGWLQLPEQER